MDSLLPCPQCGEPGAGDGPCPICGYWRCPQCGDVLYNGVGGIDVLWCRRCEVGYRLRLIDMAGQQWRAYRGGRIG